MGSLSQILLIALDHYKGVTTWNFENFDPGLPGQRNDALIQHPYGNTIFSITTLFLYLFLTIIFFFWEKIFNSKRLPSVLCKCIFPPYPDPSTHATSEQINLSAICIQEDPEKVNEYSIKDQSSVDSKKHTEGEGVHTEVLIFWQLIYILTLLIKHNAT